MGTIFLVTSISIAVILIYLFKFQVPWEVHITMTKRSSTFYEKVNFKQFKEEFEKVDWEQQSFHNEVGLFNHSNNCRIFASIININGKGLVIKDSFSYLLVEKYVKNYVLNNG